MRIDLNHGPQPLDENSRSNSAESAATGGGSPLNGPGYGLGKLGEDQAQLSGAHVQVQALAAEAFQLPEVRQERVQSLRQAIQSGQYTASPEKVAGAVLTHMIDAFAA
jgi:flagellar biosynthesis anti-sigma factor FlgM